MRPIKLRLRNRRGATLVAGVLATTTILMLLGVELDYGRLFVTRHKDQVIADACVLAAAVKMPNQSQADAEIARITSQYDRIYNANFETTTVYSGGAAPTGVRVTVTEEVPMFLPGLMGRPTRRARAVAAATLFNPTQLSGLVPIGVQYDRDFGLPLGWLPTGTTSSPTELLLKLGSGNVLELPGNFYPLALDGTGAGTFRDHLANGVPNAHSVGEIVQTETGNMAGPTTQGLDDRMARASVAPYSNDTWTSFHPDNPRVVYFPLLNWLDVSKNGRADIQILGFAAFWITRYSSGQVYGRFVRMVAPGSDATGASTFDAGLYSARLTE
jgi:hypothetical protein